MLHLSARTATEPDGTAIVLRSFERPGFALGHFVCPAQSRRWHEDNVIRNGHVLAFPRRALEIAQSGHRTVVAAPGHVMLYNREQVYRRRLLDPRGDDCYFVAMPDALVRPALRRHDPNVDDRPDQPFTRPRELVSAAAMTTLATLLRGAFEAAADDLWLEELLVQLLDQVTGPADTDHARASIPMRRRTAERHRELAATLERVLARRFTEPLALHEIADEADTSAYHAARVFRRHTGTSMHAYRTRLRLHAAAGLMLDGRPRLADLAVDLGFASHSHFCDAFVEHFGCTPSAFRTRSGTTTSVRRSEHGSGSPGARRAVRFRHDVLASHS